MIPEQIQNYSKWEKGETVVLMCNGILREPGKYPYKRVIPIKVVDGEEFAMWKESYFVPIDEIKRQKWKRVTKKRAGR